VVSRELLFRIKASKQWLCWVGAVSAWLKRYLYVVPSTKDIREHPLFLGRISRWLWRFFSFRFTTPARFLFAAITCMVFYGALSIQPPAFIPFAYVFSYAFVSLVIALAIRPRVTVTAAHADRICAGETLNVFVTVRLDGRVPGSGLSVIPTRLPKPIDAVDEFGAPLPELRRGECATVRIALRCGKRGVYGDFGYRVQTSWPLGLVNAYMVVPAAKAVTVYPAFQRLARFDLPVGRTYHPGGVALASTLGDSLEYIGNREYRVGDNVRDIDWRSTAKLQVPVVREYGQEYFLRVGVILDTQVPSRHDDVADRDFENAVSLVATVGDVMARQEYLVDIFAAGPVLYHLTAGRSLAYLDQILDILSCLEPTREEPFQKIEPELAAYLEQITTIICIFLDWTEPRRRFVDRLMRQGVAIRTIVCRSRPCTIPLGDNNGEIEVLSDDNFRKGLTDL